MVCICAKCGVDSELTSVKNKCHTWEKFYDLLKGFFFILSVVEGSILCIDFLSFEKPVLDYGLYPSSKFNLLFKDLHLALYCLVLPIITIILNLEYLEDLNAGGVFEYSYIISVK